MKKLLLIGAILTMGTLASARAYYDGAAIQRYNEDQAREWDRNNEAQRGGNTKEDLQAYEQDTMGDYNAAMQGDARSIWKAKQRLTQVVVMLDRKGTNSEVERAAKNMYTAMLGAVSANEALITHKTSSAIAGKMKHDADRAITNYFKAFNRAF